MAYTRATKAKRLASLDAQIKAARTSARNEAERDWLAQAPVSDPLPEEGGAE